jgi:hypothetical protein
MPKQAASSALQTPVTPVASVISTSKRKPNPAVKGSVARLPLPGIAGLPTLSTPIPLKEHAKVLLFHASLQERTDRVAIETHLVNLGPAVIEGLIQVLEEGNLAQQSLAALILVRLGSASIEPLQKAFLAWQGQSEKRPLMAFFQHHLQF